MTFVTRQETTWGDLREGERIVDKNDETWELLNDPQPIGSEVRVSISTDITQPTVRAVVVVKPATDTVTVIREAEEQIGVITREMLADDWVDPGLERGEEVQRKLEEALRHPSPETIQASVQAAVDEDLERAKATVEEKLGPTPWDEPVWKQAGYPSQEAMDTDAALAGKLQEAMEQPLDHEILTTKGHVEGGIFIPGPDPILEQSKAVLDDALGPTTEILPVIDTALELRSHLYLLHGVMIHEATTRAALLEHHRQSEKLEAAGKAEAGYVPHVHEEDK